MFFDGFNYIAQDNTSVITSPFISQGKYYAISNQSIISSDDGQVWHTEFAENTGNLVAIASGYTEQNPSAETHIAVGGVNTAVIHQQYGSNAATDWVEITTGANIAMTDIMFDNSQFVGVGMQCVMFTVDGYTWTTTTPNNAQTYRGVIHENGLYVIVGDNGSVETSTDGTNWTVQNTGIASSLKAIASNGYKFITVGDNGTILSSSNATSWTAESSNTTNNLIDVLWDGNQFTAVGERGFVATSPLGTTWSTACCFGNNNVTSIITDGSQLIATQGNEILTKNSTNFASISNPYSFPMFTEILTSVKMKTLFKVTD